LTPSRQRTGVWPGQREFGNVSLMPTTMQFSRCHLPEPVLRSQALSHSTQTAAEGAGGALCGLTPTHSVPPTQLSECRSVLGSSDSRPFPGRNDYTICRKRVKHSRRILQPASLTPSNIYHIPPLAQTPETPPQAARRAVASFWACRGQPVRAAAGLAEGSAEPSPHLP